MRNRIFVVMIAFVSGVIPGWRLLVAWSAGHPQLGIRERVLILGTGGLAYKLAAAFREGKDGNDGALLKAAADPVLAPEFRSRALEHLATAPRAGVAQRVATARNRRGVIAQ